MTQPTPLELVDALLAVAEKKASGYHDVILTGLRPDIVTLSAPISVAEIRAAREGLRAEYAADPVGIAGKLLPSLDALFGVVKGIVA